MRQIALLFIILTLLQFQQGCRSRQQTDSQPSDSTATTVETTPSADVPIAGRLAELGLTNNSDWRGINLGDDFATVKSTEKAEPFEDDATHTGYTVEFENLETADMLYYQKKQKVSAIEVDLFLNSRQSADANQKELSRYFTVRYGSPKPGNGSSVWTGKKGETVMLKDVSKGKDFGLKIKFAPTGNVTTASAK